MSVGAPKVSVVMSVYNGEKHIGEAIESVLGQTFTDFEFIIVNDGSTDNTDTIIDTYTDRRIRLINQEANRGISPSVNRGCRDARGAYIARIDADDTCAPERIAMEAAYLDGHPDIGVIGSWVEYIDDEGGSLGSWEPPVAPGVVNWRLLFGTCIANPTSMIRHELMQGLDYYDESIDSYAEDYDFWARACLVSKLTNLDSVLVKRRVGGGSGENRVTLAQEEQVRDTVRRLIEKKLGLSISGEDVVLLRQLVTEQIPAESKEISRVASLLGLISQRYLERVALDDRERYEVRLDAARMLYPLAHNARRCSLRLSLSITLRGVRIDPRPLHQLVRRRLRHVVHGGA